MSLRLWRREDGRSPNWYVMGTVTVWRNGRKRQLTIKPQSTRTSDRAEAEAILLQVASRYQRGNIENRDAPQTFGDLVNTYLDAGKSDRYLVPILRALADLEVPELTQAKIDAEARKAYPNASSATIRRQWHGVISAVIRHSRIPFALTLPEGSRSTTRFCTPKEAEAIIRECAAGRYKDAWKPALAETLFGTGCRAGEAMKLDGARDVSLEYRTMTFRDTKNGTERTVELVPRTLAALSRLDNIGKPGPLFRKPGGAAYAEKVEVSGHQLRFLYAAAERAGVREFHPHMTRHTFATWYYAQTHDTLGLRRRCGWRQPSMVDRYTHIAPAQVGVDAIALGWDFREKIGAALEQPEAEEKKA